MYLPNMIAWWILWSCFKEKGTCLWLWS